MRIAITGASGNVGTALLRALRTGGHDLVGLSRRRPPSLAPYDGVDWVQVDLAARDAVAVLERAIAGADAVVHLAWLIQPGRNRGLLRAANQHGTAAVVRAVRATGVPHLVHMSSVGAYSPHPGDQPIDEDWPTDGVGSSAYSVDKSAAEKIVSILVPTRTQVAIVRPSLILQDDAAAEITRYFIGPFVPRALFTPKLLRWAPFPRAMRLQFVHAHDVADALRRVVEQRAGGAFNLAAEPVIDRARWQRIYGSVGPSVPVPVLRAGAWASFHAGLQPTAPGWIDLAAGIPLLDTSRAQSVLGWRPAHPADDLLAVFLAALRRCQSAAGPVLGPGRRQPLPPGS